MVAEPMCRVGGLVVAEPMCRLVKSDFRSHSGSHQSTAWIQNPSWSRVWQYLFHNIHIIIGLDKSTLIVPHWVCKKCALMDPFDQCYYIHLSSCIFRSFFTFFYGVAS